MNKLFYGLILSVIANYSLHGIAFDPQNLKNEQESQKLKDELNRLEGSILYKRCCSPINTIRERTAFMIAVAGTCGSLVAPFKLIKSNPRHPMRTIAQRICVTVVSFSAAATAACILAYVRPILWWHEYKRDRLKEKILKITPATKIS
ncbi:hypothetical protein BH09DEP1_BH09DEP1_1120 [soil metagenome]